MENEYHFFYEFFDGQIIKPESEKFKLYKLMLFSVLSALGLFCVLSGFSSVLCFVLLECGMFWNLYLKLDNLLSFLFSIIVSGIYFIFAVSNSIYANALVYLSCYLFLQLVALSRDYSEGDFIQMKKKITDSNKILLVIFFSVSFVLLYLLDVALDGSFMVLDTLSATLLLCSALLRNERYFEFYIFRIFAIVVSLVLWITISVETSTLAFLPILLMYLSYLVNDTVNFVAQYKTYESQETRQVKEFMNNYKNKKIADKIMAYEKINENKNQELQK